MMLRYGLQRMHGKALELPVRRGDWPDRDRLATGFIQFGQTA